MNDVKLVGRLARDPRYIKGVLKITLAIDRPKTQDGSKVTDFPSITVFGKQAESGYKYLSKGRQIAVEASIETGSYTDRTGKTVYTQDIVARRVEYLDYSEQSKAPEADKEPEDFEALDEGLPF